MTESVEPKLLDHGEEGSRVDCVDCAVGAVDATGLDVPVDETCWPSFVGSTILMAELLCRSVRVTE